MTSGGAPQRWRRAVLAGAVLAAVAAVFYRALFTDQIFISRDIQRVYYPLKQYWSDRVAHGEFPQWYPFDGLGQPFIGMVISGAFHPLNLLYVFLPLGVALKMNTLVCYPFAFFGTYLFARRWSLSIVPAALAGFLFSFNGYMIAITNNLLYLMAASTFPWALWAVDRLLDSPSAPRAVLGSGLIALVLFAGDGQSFALCLVATGLLALLRHQPGRMLREAAAVALLLALALLFASPLIVPAIRVLPESVSSQRTLRAALIWSMHPLRLTELVWGPLFGGQPGDPISASIDLSLLKTGIASLWAESAHFGLSAFALAIAGLVIHWKNPKTWLLLLAAGVLLLLILGRFAGAYELAFRAFPLWRSFRFPEKLLPYLLFILALSAAVGLQSALGSHRAKSICSLALGLGAILSLGFFAFEATNRIFSEHLVPALWDGQPPQQALARLHRAFLTATAQSGIVAALVALAAWNSRRRWWASMVPALCFADLAVANEPLYNLTFPDLLRSPTAFVSAIQEREGTRGLGRFRVDSGVDEHEFPRMRGLTVDDAYAVSIATSLLPDVPALWGLESADAYLPAESRRVQELIRDPRVWYFQLDGNFSVRYTVLPKWVFEKVKGRREVLLLEHPSLGLVLLENLTASPRASLRRARCVADRQEAFRQVVARSFDPTREAVVECDGPAPASSYEPSPSDAAQIVSYAPERVEIHTQSTRPAILVLNDAFYIGWIAEVDRRPTTIWPTNHGVRGVPIGAGEHTIVFSYRTPGLLVGLLLSFSSLVAVLIFSPLLRRISAMRSQKTSLSASPQV